MGITSLKNQKSFSSTEQITKLGVTASTTTPKTIKISMTETTSFDLPPLEVLHFNAGSTNQITTQVAFNNADSTDFNADNQVVFDGTMRLKNIYQSAMTDNGALGSGKQFSQIIDKTAYKAIEKVEVV